MINKNENLSTSYLVNTDNKNNKFDRLEESNPPERNNENIFENKEIKNNLISHINTNKSKIKKQPPPPLELSQSISSQNNRISISEKEGGCIATESSLENSKNIYPINKNSFGVSNSNKQSLKIISKEKKTGISFNIDEVKEMTRLKNEQFGNLNFKNNLLSPMNGINM